MKCCVKTCFNTNKNSKRLSFFRIPLNFLRKQAWLKLLNIKNFSEGARVCSEHFEKKNLIQKQKYLTLSKDALPTIFASSSKVDEKVEDTISSPLTSQEEFEPPAKRFEPSKITLKESFQSTSDTDYPSPAKKLRQEVKLKVLKTAYLKNKKSRKNALEQIYRRNKKIVELNNKVSYLNKCLEEAKDKNYCSILMIEDSVSQITGSNAKFFENLCRFCGEQSSKNLKIDNSWNEIFFEVIKKLFSFTIETLDGSKICTSCVAIIESIYKFYNQVKNVAQMLLQTENSIKNRNDITVNSKHGSKPHKCSTDKKNNNENSDEGCLEINSEIITIENNPFHIEESNTFDDNAYNQIDQEIFKIEEQDIFEKTEDNNNYSKKESNDPLSIISTSPFLKEENENEANYLGKKIENSSIKRNEISDKILASRCNLKEYGKLRQPVEEEYLCSDKTFSLKNINRDIRTQHAQDQVMGKICCQEFATGRSLKLHRINCKYRSEFKCEVCGTTCFSKSGRDSHKKIHWTAEEKEANAQKCPHCDKKYWSKVKLNLHIRKIHDKDPFVCNICNKAYIHEGGLRQHRRIFHRIDEKQKETEFKCPHCDAIYPFKQSMIKHVRTVHLNERFTCKICHNDYTTNRALRIHETKVHQ